LIEARKGGRPRNPDVDEAIFRATAELLGEAGYANLSIDGVAQRAAVARQSIYRRFPSKLELVTALMRDISESAPLPDTGSLRGDLRALYRLYTSNLLTPGGPIIPSLVAEAMHDTELSSIVVAYVDKRRLVAMQVFQRAIERREMRADADPGMLIDLISGYFWYRKLIRKAPISRDDITTFVNTILKGIET
jgi:AcrR family transcriptional regulator